MVGLLLGWIASALLLIAILFNGHFLSNANPWIVASVSSIKHTLWAMVLCWIILASISQNRGNQIRTNIVFFKEIYGEFTVLKEYTLGISKRHKSEFS